ncbi:hypothetical protein, partial [Rhodovulum sulfidophilum]|uniref:hypothetical protein n=1 Tax=Rhodovulum sulfidophilum TaxID=35806 RepID=UPI001A923EC8
SAWRSTPMIWASVKRLFFIGISSSILPRKFYVRIPLTTGRITGVPRHAALTAALDSLPPLAAMNVLIKYQTLGIRDIVTHRAATIARDEKRGARAGAALQGETSARTGPPGLRAGGQNVTRRPRPNSRGSAISAASFVLTDSAARLSKTLFT